jgi:hypothetical protein
MPRCGSTCARRENEVAVAKKSIIVSDISGREIRDPKDSAKVAISYGDARRGRVALVRAIGAECSGSHDWREAGQVRALHGSRSLRKALPSTRRLRGNVNGSSSDATLETVLRSWPITIGRNFS